MTMHPLIAGQIAREIQDEARRRTSVWRRVREARKSAK